MKTALLLVLIGVAASASCLYSKPIELCIRSQDCAGDPDPAATCGDDYNDCDGRSDCAAARDRCAAATEAVSACLLENGTCDDVEGQESKIFGLEATAEGAPCRELQIENDVCLSDGNQQPPGRF